MNISVIKIGGNILDDEKSLSRFLDLFAAVEGAKILIHGGGKLASELCAQMNITVQMIDGRRVTDAETLKIITMVYAGYINKNIVALLQARSCNALGLSGADGNLIQAHKRINSKMDYGFAGDIDAINDQLLQSLLASGFTVVVSPLTHDKKGQLLNTNADTIAQEIARAMSVHGVVRLLYCFEKAGVLSDIEDESTVIPAINENNLQQLITNGTIHSGMLPKINNAFEAVRKGVYSVTIGKWDQLHLMLQGTSGTIIKQHS
jgi:acetylglutamate kinase